MASRLRLCRTGLDKDDITILNNVVLALGHDLTLRLAGSFITFFPQCGVVVHNTLDEGLLKVAVDNTRSLRRLGTSSYRPLSDFVGTGCEEAAKLKSLAHRLDGLGKRRLGAQVLELLGSLSVGHDGNALLECYGDGDDWVTRGVVLDPFSNLGQILVLLTDVVLLTQVDEVYDRLGGEEEERVDVLDLTNCK